MADNVKFTEILNMSTLGDKLREVREGKNITFSQAQRETRIHQTVLKALEDGKCDSILNATYVKSFLKKYADYLGIDSRQVLSEYRKLNPETESVVVNKLPEQKSYSENVSAVIPFLKLAAVAAIVVAVSVLLLFKVISYFNKPGISKAVPASRTSNQAARSKPSKKVPRQDALPKKNTEMAIPKNVQLKLLLKVNKAVLIKMKVDGTLLFERQLPKGTAEIFTADDIINIYAANGEYIELVLNGKSIGSPGKGLLKNIEITRSGVKLK